MRTEMVSPERAEAVYGAVFKPDGSLDRNATEANRRELMQTEVPDITYGKTVTITTGFGRIRSAVSLPRRQ